MAKNEVQVFEVQTSAKFNENDLVTVAVAKGETMMREKIISLKEQIVKLEGIRDKTSIKHNKTIENITSPLHKAKPELLKALKKVNKKATLEIFTSPSSYDNTPINVVRLIFGGINGVDSGGRGRTDLANMDVPETQEQKTLRMKIEKITDDLQDLKNEALSMKRKLSDIPALERQMRAKVVENQIGKTAGGKEFLDTLINGTDISKTLNLLGM